MDRGDGAINERSKVEAILSSPPPSKIAQSCSTHRDALDVITKYLSVTLGTTLAQTLSSLTTTRHVISFELRDGSEAERGPRGVRFHTPLFGLEIAAFEDPRGGGARSTQPQSNGTN